MRAGRRSGGRGGDDGRAFNVFQGCGQAVIARGRVECFARATPCRILYTWAPRSSGGCCPHAAFTPRRQNDRQRSDGAARSQHRAPLMEVSGSITLIGEARGWDYAGARKGEDKFFLLIWQRRARPRHTRRDLLFQANALEQTRAPHRVCTHVTLCGHRVRSLSISGPNDVAASHRTMMAQISRSQ